MAMHSSPSLRVLCPPLCAVVVRVAGPLKVKDRKLHDLPSNSKYCALHLLHQCKQWLVQFLLVRLWLQSLRPPLLVLHL